MPEKQEKSEMANAAALYQDIHLNVTSKDTEVNGGLYLSVKWAKPNNGGPVLENSKSSVSKEAKLSEKANLPRGKTTESCHSSK